MATVLSIMDRNSWSARTDNIAVVSVKDRSVTLIPRDLFSSRVDDRINTVMGIGGHALFFKCLQDYGFPVNQGICLLPEATAKALATMTLEVPVEKEETFLYPNSPLEPIHLKNKIIKFSPPKETLSGERIHQWLGARIHPDWQGSDLDRLRRQIVFTRCLIRAGFDFRKFLEFQESLKSTGDQALGEIREVREDWKFSIYDHVRHWTVNGKQVLVPA